DRTSGGSHWLEHAHFLGTPRRPNNQAVFGDIAAVGGDINATTGWELTDYYIAVPVEHFDTALDVLADMLLDSQFPVEAFNRERRVVFEELNRRANTPSTLASDLFYSNVFQVHPARRLIGGTIDSVRNIPLDVILDYRAQRYVAGNMTIGVAGAVDHDTAVAKVDRAFQRLPAGPWIDRPVVFEPPAREPRALTVSLGDKQVVLIMGNLAPAITHPDREAFYVLDSILDTTGRRLATEIRDKRGLATSVGASYYGLTDIGAWAVSAITRPEHLDEVLAILRRELQRLRDEEPTEDEVADAVRSIRGSQRLREERNLSQARSLARETALGILEPTAEWLARLDTVTPADVRRVAQRYLNLDTTTLVTVSF
ncbi:MAG: insulinase family protein, partial [Dehalococcoidia bacterium]|nr:insulinase family protein [Dehalococcoidia bacterium]